MAAEQGGGSEGTIRFLVLSPFLPPQCVRILLDYVTRPQANGWAEQHGMEQLHMDTPHRQSCA
jgi:hypothetical protein